MTTQNAQTETVAGSDSPVAGQPAADAGRQEPPAPDAGSDLDKTRAELNRANKEAAERRVALKQAQDELTALKAAQTQAEQAALAERGEYQKLYEAEKQKAADLEKAAAEMQSRIKQQELAALRQRVANEKGLPATLAERLQGETAEELAADAETLLAAIPRPTAPSMNGATRGANGAALSEADARQIAGRFNIDPRYLKD